MMVCLLVKERVDRKGIDLSLAYASWTKHVMYHDESHEGTGGCNQPL